MLLIFTRRKSIESTVENRLSNLLIGNSDEILKYMILNNKIDIVDTQMQIEKMKNEKYLEMHNHTIWQGKDGKWRTYLDDESERGYSLKVRVTKEGIESLVCKYYKDKEEDPYIEEVFEAWNNQRFEYGEISNQTYNRYTTDFKRFVTKDCVLYQKRFSQITESDLEVFIKSTICTFGLTAKAYANMRTIIRGVFKYAKKKGYTHISITTFLGDLELSRKAFKKRVVNREEEVFNESEQKQVYSYLRNRATIRDLGLLLAFQTGMRVGELSGLKRNDIISGKRMIHVQRTEITYKDHKSGERICEVRDFPKTEAGDRYVLIPDMALDTIDAILKLNPNGEYLFCENGKRIRANAFNRRLTRVCDDLHIKHRSVHKIRKTYGTTLIDQNVDECLIAEQMGHKDIATTRKYYYFCNKDNEAKFAQINKALSC